ncbi:glycosyl transferase [Sphingomonas crocodyli]|uniref:Glycosyl transferase n=1 Tax=Sphingomonas crocodyli TaxID=1979270 RepID=A0A437M8I5_9SPHN|nr:glycosyl transferase [Sphingomonas crocodyli]RVT93897.1 glycosyl transferase [Sphingomonas crocodyli]
MHGRLQHKIGPQIGPSLAFIFIGGEHQALHLAPVAAEIAARAGDVTAYVADEADARAIRNLFVRLDAPHIPIRVMALPRWLIRPGKTLRLLRWSAELRNHDAIVTAERTSTRLRHLPGRTPPMIHIPHGAGDRAVGFEDRLRLFDHIIVAGPKDRRRMIAEGLVRPDRCSISGYIKLAAVERIAPPIDLGLDPARPTILYNPHFSAALGSWDRMGRAVVDRIIADGRFNLILAPHVRLRKRIDRASIAEIEALAVPGRVLVDLGSARSCDMSYTRAADIYLGDVSSQIYEFLAKPRPCVFLDPARTAWRGNPDYAMWRYGAVACDPDAAMAELGRSQALHPVFLATQQRGAADAMGSSGADAPQIAARQLLDAIAKLTSPTTQEEVKPIPVLLTVP